MWEWVESNDTLAVGIIGFIGVMATLWFNGWQGRQQKLHEVDHERNVLRTALLAELKINRNAFERNTAGEKSIAPSQGLNVPVKAMDDLYAAFISKLGLLTTDEVSKIMFAYLSLRTYRENLYLVGAAIPSLPHHVQVPPSKVEAVFTLEKNLIGPFDEAISAVDAHLH